MHKKIFPLDQVLRYRSEVERARKLEFAAAKMELEAAEEWLKRDEEQVRKTNAEFLTRQEQGMAAEEIWLYSAFFSRKREEIISRREDIARFTCNVQQKMEHLLEAMKEKKALEQLKEKKMKMHNKLLADKERAFLDDVALQTTGRTL